MAENLKELVPPADNRCMLCGRSDDIRLYPVEQKYDTRWGKKGKIWWLCQLCYNNRWREDLGIPQKIGIHWERKGEVKREEVEE